MILAEQMINENCRNCGGNEYKGGVCIHCRTLYTAYSKSNNTDFNKQNIINLLKQGVQYGHTLPIITYKD